MSKVALQMYTLRDLSARDFAGTFRQVAEIGYRAVELASTGDLPANEMKQLLDKLSLRAVAAHESIEMLEAELDRLCTYYSKLAIHDLVCPFMPEQRRKTAEDWCSFAQSLDQVGMQLAQRGFRLHYHNHDFELDLEQAYFE